MSNHPPDGYPARNHPPPHQQQHPYYAPPPQQPPPPQGPPPAAPPPQHMYQAQQHQQPYYGAPPMGPPQPQPPAGYYSPPHQAQYNNHQYGKQQAPPPGYAQPYGQRPQQPQYYPPQQQQQPPPGIYPPPGNNNFPPGSQPMQYQQPPPGSYPLTSQPSYSPSGHYPPTSQGHNQNGYGQQYPPTSMGGNSNNYSQQPPMYSNNSYAQQPYPHHQPSTGGYNKPPPQQYGGMPPQHQQQQQHSQQPPLYPGQSHNGTNPGGSGSSGMNGTGGLVHQGSFPGASAPNLSPQPSIQQSMTLKLCSSGLPVIDGDNCRAPIKLRVEEKIMEASGDSFYVTDSKKKILYNVDGSRTPDQHKILKTAKGKPLLQMRQFSTVAKKIVISNMKGEAIATLQKQRVESNTHKRIDGTLHCGNTNSKFIVAGNAQASSFQVDNGHEQVVAEISRASRSMKKIFSGQDSYTADVSAGSPAFMVMVVVAIDEIYCDG